MYASDTSASTPSTSARTPLILRRQRPRTRHGHIEHNLPAPIPNLPIAPHSRLPIRPRRPRLDIEMHPAATRILIPIARAAAPVITSRITRVDNLHRDGGTRADAVVVGVCAAGGELVALAAGGAAVGLAGGVEVAGEELLVHGCVVEAGGAGPLPGGLAALAGGAHPAVVLWVRVSAWSRGFAMGMEGETYGCGSHAVEA